MADEPEQPVAVGVDVEGEEELTPGYKAPKQKTLEEIQQLDADDESLVKYKESLLAGADKVLDEGGNNVVVKALVFAPEGREGICLNLTGDLTTLKNKPFVLKEGTSYKIHIEFRVQREIVSGLRYMQEVYRKGIKVDKNKLMVGSYGPKTEAHVYKTPSEEAPAGLLHRGTYVVKSKFSDDDKNSILEWEWSFQLKKDWE